MKTNSIIITISTIAASVLAYSVIAQDIEGKRQIVPQGDPANGRTLFEDKQCFRCHTVEGQKFPDADLPGVDFIRLAGENNRGWDRDLYASQIMDPQHLISPDHQKAMLIIGDRLGAENSPMPDFNRALKVGEMIDLATFLEEQTQLTQQR